MTHELAFRTPQNAAHRIFRVDSAREAADFAAKNKRQVEPLERRTLVVTNPNLESIRLDAIPGRLESGVTISRVRHGEETHAATDAIVIHRDDRLAVVGTRAGLDQFERVFFAPHQGYAVREAVAEFREMVRAFHAAGIEVWLDVVYNHTCEGDERGPTYSWRGNNNPYNQDNETTWLDWSLLEEHREIFRFFQLMIAFRKSRRSIARGRYWREDVRWHGADGPVDFGPESRCLAYCVIGERFGEGDLYVMINAFWQPVLFRVQDGAAGEWKRLIDTSRPSPDDVLEPGNEVILDTLIYQLAPRSIAVLVREPANAT